MLSINELCARSHSLAVEKGWYDQTRTLPELIALMHSELSEALEEYRKGYDPSEVRIVDGKPEGVPIELADACIRIFDACAAMGIDLEAAIETKHAYNRSRPYRHGGKRA